MTNVSRYFLIIGAAYLIVGMILGSYMGASGDHSLVAVHAHINLLGFALSTIFGLAYRLIPGLADTALAKAHFWLHEVGSLIVLVALYLLISGRLPPETVGPVLPVAELAIIGGAVVWLIQVIRRA
ncbi:MAG: hypothetical protein EBU97_03865 [Rhodobacteraceae bacterium]|nr:hypothetical protein [Paracoccaceae bacterium]